MTSIKLHDYPNDPQQWYVEEAWAVDALLNAGCLRRPMGRVIYDPCCGMGTIPEAAVRAGYAVLATDLFDRGYGTPNVDFFSLSSIPGVDLVSNPPYGPRVSVGGRSVTTLERWIDHALKITDDLALIAVFTRLSFLASSGRYAAFTERWPLASVLICSDRVNCLPGDSILNGQKPGGGAIDYCWIVLNKNQRASKLPIIGFLRKGTDDANENC